MNKNTRSICLFVLMCLSQTVTAENTHNSSQYGFFIENGEPLSIKWSATKKLIVIPAMGTHLTTDLGDNQLLLGLGLRYFMSRSRLNHFTQIGGRSSFQVDTLNASPRLGFDIEFIDLRYGIEYYLMEQFTVEGALIAALYFRDSGYNYLWPIPRLGLTYYW